MTQHIIRYDDPRWGRACPDDVELARTLYPNGIPLTLEAAERLHDANVHIIWGLVHLLPTRQDTEEFTRLALRQLLPHVARLLREAGLLEYAAQVEVLRLETRADAESAALGVLRRAVRAADAADAEDAADAVRAAGAACGAWQDNSADYLTDIAWVTAAFAESSGSKQAVMEQARWCLERIEHWSGLNSRSTRR